MSTFLRQKAKLPLPIIVYNYNMYHFQPLSELFVLEQRLRHIVQKVTAEGLLAVREPVDQGVVPAVPIFRQSIISPSALFPRSMSSTFPGCSFTRSALRW